MVKKSFSSCAPRELYALLRTNTTWKVWYSLIICFLCYLAGCKFALLPIREENGALAATTASWFNIDRAAASDKTHSVYRSCVLPHSTATGGYRSIGKFINLHLDIHSHSLLSMSTQTGLAWILVVVLYQSGSMFDLEVQANLTAGLPIVAEKKDFETAYDFPSPLQIINQENSSMVVPSVVTT